MAKKKAFSSPDDLYSGFLEVASNTLGSEFTDAPINYWLSTGCSLLDWAIKMGVPGGRVAEVYGAESSGKSALALSICRQAQLRGGIAIWLDTEAGFSEELARDIVGVNLEAGWIYRRPFTTEQTLNAIEAFTDFAVEKSSQAPVVLVVDSIAGMCAEQQSSGEFGEVARQQGKNAGLMSWFTSRPTLKKILGTNVFLIFLNQTRATLEFKRYGPPPEDTTPGGRAMRFFSTCRIEMSRIRKEEDTNKHSVGVMLRAYIKKNKCGLPWREVHFPFYFRDDQPIKGIDDPMSLLTYLISRKVMAQKAGGWYILDGVQARKSEWRDKMIKDPEVLKMIKAVAYEAFQAEHGAIPDPESLPEISGETDQ